MYYMWLYYILCESYRIYTNTITGTEGVYSHEREESDRQETDEKETKMIQGDIGRADKQAAFTFCVI